MMNEISPNAIFLSSAFEPSHEELRAYARSEKDRSRRTTQERKPLLVLPRSKPAPRRPPPVEINELSSDEEMPDFSQILAGSKKASEGMLSLLHATRRQLNGLLAKAKGKANGVEEVSFCAGSRGRSLTLSSLQKKPRASGLFDVSDEDDDDDESDEVEPGHRAASSSRGKGKLPAAAAAREITKPSQHTVATWRRDDDDMEPSAKMIALVEQLRVAEDAGDKTIVYSQCGSSSYLPLPAHRFQLPRGRNVLMTLIIPTIRDRDVDAELVGDAVGALWGSVLAV
jgi:hypothetical protein